MPEYPDRDPKFGAGGGVAFAEDAHDPEPDRHPRISDLSGRQAVNASDATEPSSLVTLRQVDGKIANLPSNGGGGSADLVYNGAFPATSPYTDGDIVIYGGVAYLCVRPTSGPPAPWPTSLSGGDKTYVHDQVPLATTWVVVHNLGKYASVEVVNTGGNTIIPDIQYDSANQVTLTFTVPTSGKAYVN